MERLKIMKKLITLFALLFVLFSVEAQRIHKGEKIGHIDIAAMCMDSLVHGEWTNSDFTILVVGSASIMLYEDYFVLRTGKIVSTFKILSYDKKSVAGTAIELVSGGNEITFRMYWISSTQAAFELNDGLYKITLGYFKKKSRILRGNKLRI